MVTALKISTVESKDLDVDFEDALKECIPIKVRDIIPDRRLPCDLYFPSFNRAENRIELFPVMVVGQVCERDFLETMKSEDVDEIYIKQEDEDAFQHYFDLNVRRMLQSSDVPSYTKTELLYDSAINIVKRLFREQPNEVNLHLGRKLVSNFVTHISVDNVGSQALFALFSKDYYTFSHCVQVAFLGMAFCRFLGWSNEEVNDFGMGALVHDVGKNAIDLRILNKPGKLHSEEFEIIRKHPLLGYSQLEGTEVMTPDQLSVVLHHHEAMDGSGYPHRLRGSHIHKYARLARIVDIFDALTTKRIYKEAMSSAEALRVLQDEMAHTLDEQLLDSFTKFIAPEMTPEELARGLRVQLQFGGQLQLQLEEGGGRVKGTFLGLEGEKYLILKVPGHVQVFEQLRQGKSVIVRYVSEGCVYGFRTQVMAQITYPFPMVFLTYPRAIENVNLRKENRVECQVASELIIDDLPYHGFILDLTSQGCKFLMRSSAAVPVPPIELHQPVQVRTTIPGHTELRSFSGIVRSVQDEQDRAYLGIQFVNLSEGALFLLKKFTAEHQRPVIV